MYTKFKMTKENQMILITVAIVIITLTVYLIFYTPLMKELRVGHSESRSIRNQVFDARNIIEAAGKTQREGILATEEDISRVIRELTNHGVSKGINFVSISPGKVTKEKDHGYKILPIKMEIESTYELLGEFLGSLDELEKALITVKSFNIAPHREGPSKLVTNLVVYVYLLERKTF